MTTERVKMMDTIKHIFRMELILKNRMYCAFYLVAISDDMRNRQNDVRKYSRNANLGTINKLRIEIHCKFR